MLNIAIAFTLRATLAAIMTATAWYMVGVFPWLPLEVSQGPAGGFSLLLGLLVFVPSALGSWILAFTPSEYVDL